ncbi:MAG: PEP-CTERM sorting domain-containing protein [Kiritimatiellia bacterium]
MNTTKLQKRIQIGSAALLTALAMNAHAAIITVSNVQDISNATLSANLSTLGTTDWVVWNAWSGSTAVQFDSKSGGSGIGDLTYSGGGGNVGENSPAMLLDYNDGTNFAGSQTTSEGIGRQLNGGSATFTYTFTLGAGTNQVNLFLSKDERPLNSTLTASIVGSTPGSTTFNVGGYANDKNWQFAVDVSDAVASDVLTVTWDGGSGGEWASRMIANAATLTIVPEPSSIALVGLALASLLLFRRRK